MTCAGAPSTLFGCMSLTAQKNKRPSKDGKNCTCNVGSEFRWLGLFLPHRKCNMVFFFYRCERHLRNIIHFKLNTFRCKDGGFLRGIFGRIIFPWRVWRFALIQMNCLIILPVSNPHAHRFVITCNLKITFNSTQRNRLLGVIVFDPFVRPAFC